MGQYYTPILKSEKEGLGLMGFSAHQYDNGLKLMEHSYIGNKFTETIVKFMIEEGGKFRVAWVGDYADSYVAREEIPNPLYENEEYKELYKEFIDYEKELEDPAYMKADPIKPMENSSQLIFINHSKKEYIDMNHYIDDNKSDDWGYRIHPLPLLTAIGNGYGGGDYHKEDKLVGYWACDEIEVVDWIKDNNIKKDYKEIRPIFNED